MTIGATRLNVAQVIDKAVRRCGLNPATITSEVLDSARESLFMLLSSLTARGLNLWAIDTQYITLIPGQATYTLPAGTEDVLNLLFTQPTETTTGEIRWVAPTFASTPVGDQVELQGSEDGWLTFDILKTIAGPTVIGKQWYKIDPPVGGDTYEYDVLGASAFTLASTVSDLRMTPLNRDDYSNIPDKTRESEVSTNFWFEKLVNPQVTLWPVPSVGTSFLTLIRHRQIADVGGLNGDIEIPARWYEPVCWHLALRLAFEIPGVDPNRLAAVQAMANTMTFEVEQSETDSAPIYFAPNIGVYTQ